MGDVTSILDFRESRMLRLRRRIGAMFGGEDRFRRGTASGESIENNEVDT